MVIQVEEGFGASLELLFLSGVCRRAVLYGASRDTYIIVLVSQVFSNG